MSKEVQYTANPLNFPNLLVPKKTMSYRRWWESSIKSDNPNFWKSNKETAVTHGEYVIDFYYKLKELINESGYVIEDEKQFKDEIATLIYHLSNEE